jgi:hypothetical protein
MFGFAASADAVQHIHAAADRTDPLSCFLILRIHLPLSVIA